MSFKTVDCIIIQRNPKIKIEFSTKVPNSDFVNQTHINQLRLNTTYVYPLWIQHCISRENPQK